jgi:septal ring factor EnvC (AmiA/AmiB activator)
MTPLAQEAAQARQARDQAASQVASTQEALEAARQNVAELQAALEAAETPQERIALTRQIAAAERTVKNLEAQLPAADAALAEAERRLAQVLRDQERAILGEFPAADRPIALLPVRLETRFVTTAGKAELLVRVYPDEIHVDAHEPGLTADESQWGKHFWAETWRTGTADTEAAVARRNQIWEQIAQRYGAGRATWIVLALKPTNPGDRPAQPVAEGQPLPRAPIHPSPPSRADSWTRAPEARSLPDRWIVLGYRAGERVVLEAGAPIAPRLAVGPDPSAPPPSPPPGDDQLAVDPGMRWLVDFAEAEKVGMGLRIPLTAGASPGFDTLIVFGVRSTQSPSEAATALADLFAAHRFTEGLAFIAPGTPTNNTEARGSGFAPRTLDAPATYPVITAAPPPPADANAAVLAHAVGIGADLLAPLPSASAREQADARAMQTLLWPATGGYFLEQLFNVFPDTTLAAARGHFLDFARAAGPLPALRVGRQPYGLLPTTSLDRWLPTTEEAPFLNPLRALRDRLRSAVPKVPRLDRRQTATQQPSEAAILNVLESSPTSSDYAARLAFDHALFGIRGFHTRFELPQQLVRYEQNMRTLLGALGVAGTPRLLATVLANTAADLRDAPVLGPEGATPTEAQFLQWLRDSPYQAIQNETGLTAKPNGLLYLVLRHSVLLAYAMTAFDIQHAAGAVDAAARAEPAIVDVLETRTRTVGRHAEHPLPGLGDRALHTLTATDHPAAAPLDEMRASLDRLRALPRDRLAALFTGTLDLFAYRVDAWITSLATRRLHELRKVAPAGVIAGGFGWLEDVRPAAPRQTVTPPPDEAGSPLTVDPANAGFMHAPSLNQAATAAVLRSGYRALPGEQDTRPFAVDLSSRRVRLAEWLLDGVRAGQPLGALLGYRFERALHDRRLDVYIAAFRRIAPFGELAKAEVTAQDSAAKAARLKTAPHPELAPATTALTAAQSKHAALTQEQSRLPGQISAADTKLKNLTAERAELIEEAQRLQKRLERFPNDEIAQEKLLDVNLRLKEIGPQISSTRTELTQLQQRQSVIAGEVDAAKRDLDAKQKRVDDLKKLPHPGLAAAEKAAADAKRRFDELLKAARERRLYPPTASVEAIESAEVTHVVDGLALHELHQANAIPFGKKKLPAPNTADHRALVEELGALQAAVDAIRDALTAESVHQLVQGNPVRAGASLDAVARSEVPPPELEFARTPRSGIAVTHRVLMLWNAPSQTPASWPSDARQVRAGVEPVVHAWVASLLGDPQAIRCDVHYADPQSGAALAERELRMQSAGLGPLDLLALVDETGGARPELARYLADRALANRPQGMRADARVKLVFEREADWPADVRSFAEVFEVARAVNAMLGNVRPLRDADLALPNAKVPPATDLAELRARADAAVKSLSVAHAALDRALGPEGDGAGIGNALVQMLFFGFAESVPALSTADAPDAVAELRGRARSVEQQACRRLDEARAVETAFDRAKATPEAQREHDIARIRTVLGGAFVVLPRIARAEAGELGAAMNDSEARFGGDRLAPLTWLDRMAHVRRAVERLQSVVLYGEALGRGTELRVAQLPFVAGERWIALSAAEGKPLPAGKLSLVVHTPDPLDPAQPVAGLFVDEWVELVPAATQTTGIAFNFDEPAAQPPQAVLLAVLPRGESRWGLDVLEAILLETLDLARLRAVAPEQIAPQTDLEEILPALYFALNLDDATVSTDFRRATGPA